jgi:FkbM family methyltransferase
MRTIFDVGAHQGQTTQQFTSDFPVETVYAFEPAPDNYRALQRTAEPNCVVTEQCALSSKEGSMELNLSNHSTAHSLEAPGERRSSLSVVVTTIDRYCTDERIPHIDLLKIDTEGHDLEVLKGAESMLRGERISYVLAEISLDPN